MKKISKLSTAVKTKQLNDIKATKPLDPIKLADDEIAKQEITKIMSDDEKPINLHSSKWKKYNDTISIMTDMDYEEYTIDNKLIEDMKKYTDLRKKYPDITPNKTPQPDPCIGKIYITHDGDEMFLSSTILSVMSAIKNAMYGYYKNEQSNKLNNFEKIEGLKVVTIGYVKGITTTKNITTELKKKILDEYIEKTDSELTIMEDTQMGPKTKKKTVKKTAKVSPDVESRLDKLEASNEKMNTTIEKMNATIEMLLKHINISVANDKPIVSEDTDNQKVLKKEGHKKPIDEKKQDEVTETIINAMNMIKEIEKTKKPQPKKVK